MVWMLPSTSQLTTFVALFILAQVVLNIFFSTQSLVELSSTSAVLKSGNFHTLHSDNLVPGDYSLDDNDDDNEDNGEDDVVIEARNEDFAECTLLPENEAPTPVILMAVGRSGSSITWQTITQLTGKKNIAYEKNGHTPEDSVEFFRELEMNDRKTYQWPVDFMCKIQRRHMLFDVSSDDKSAIVGFQWKPHEIHHEYSKEGLRAVAAQQHPPIRVIFLNRNIIDRIVSNLRHDQQNLGIPAHCEVGDKECLRKHKDSIEKGVNFPVGKELLNRIDTALKSDRYLRVYLDRYKVQYIEVDYEKLYNSDNAKEWKRIFKFLGKGPSEKLTMEEVRSAFTYAPTSTGARKKKRLREIIRNYREVEKTLKGTKFHKYLKYIRM